MKSYDDLVREAESVKDTEAELEGLVPVKARVAANPGVVYSLRLSRDEMDRISDAAARQGVSVAAFLRMAALAAVEGQVGSESAERAVTLQEVRERARELAEAVSRL